MPRRSPSKPYTKWGVVDTTLDDAFVQEAISQDEAERVSKTLNSMMGRSDRYAPAKHVGFGKYRRLDAAGGAKQ